MRLSTQERKAIKETVELLDQDAKVYLFGSRVDDQKKGGDIDLLILTERLTQEDGAKIRSRLWDKLGEQKIDILIAKDESHPFTRIALREGVLL